MKYQQNLLRLIPLFQTGLNFLTSLFRSHGFVHDSRSNAPEFILEVWFTARKDLVGIADRGFAFLPPAKELVGKRIIQCHLGIAQREEARQRICIQLGKFIGSNPTQEGLCLFRMRCLGIHAHGNVGVIADIALIASIFNIGLEDAEVETGILFKLTNLPRAGRVNSTLAECEESSENQDISPLRSHQADREPNPRGPAMS